MNSLFDSSFGPFKTHTKYLHLPDTEPFMFSELQTPLCHVNSPRATGAPDSPETHTQTEYIHRHRDKETLIIVVPVSTTSTVLLAWLREEDTSLESMSGKSLPRVLLL